MWFSGGALVKVSIVICNYNYEKFLNQAISSAHHLHYANKEIIVVDDGSTDSSREILKTWENKIQVIYQENGGQISAYNTGFNASSGELIIFLDSDDTLDANLIEMTLPYFIDANVVKVHFKMRLIDESSHPLGASIPSNLSEGALSHYIIQKGWLHFSSPGSGNIYRVSALKKLFPLPNSDDDKHGADFFCIYGVCFLGEVKAISSCLAGYRVHNKEISNSQNVNLVFGNASKKTDELTRFKNRSIRFIDWMKQRTNGSVVIKTILTDFSIMKQRFVRDVFEKPNYFHGFISGLLLIPKVANSIFMRVNFPFVKKCLLLCWALVVLVLPRQLGIKLAVKVSNPATR